MKFPPILLFLLIVLSQYTQAENTIDELKNSIVNAETDSFQVQILLKIAEEYEYTNLDSCSYYAKKGLGIALKINNKYLEGLSNLH